jgi:hypothetical protein
METPGDFMDARGGYGKNVTMVARPTENRFAHDRRYTLFLADAS